MSALGLLALAGIVALVLGVLVLRAMVKEHGPHKLAWRYATGAHLDGRVRTDAGWFRRGTRVLHPTGHASRWAHMPRAHRAAWRAAVPLVLFAVLAGLLLARTVTLWGLGAGVLAGLAFAGRRAWRAVRGRRHNRTVVVPLSAALAPYLGISPRAAEAALSVKPGYADVGTGEHVAALSLPDHWAATADQRRQVEEVTQARFGIDLRFQWRTASYPMVVNVTRAPVPPALVPLAGVLAELESCPPEASLLGRAADGSLSRWDRASEDPHIAVHGGSRRGKTSLLLSLAAQDLARGGEVTAIDPKRVSLMALAGLPGVTLLNDPRDVRAMWAGVAAFRAEVDTRYEALAEDPTLEFPRKLLIIDEVSMFSAMSAHIWRQEKEKSDPAVPPVWNDVAAGVWLGAQVHAHVIVAGQRLDYQVLGGMLGSFGVRMLAGYGPSDYARLVGVPPFLRSQKARGRFLLYAGGDLTWLQLVLGSPGEWRDYVLAAAAARRRESAPVVPGEVAPATSDPVVGLAAGAGHLGIGVDAFRKRRERLGVPRGEFRVGNQPAWNRADLDRWAGRVAS